MNTAPTAQEQFDESASATLTAIYLTPDVVAQRDKVLALLAPQPGEQALDIGCGPGLTTEALARAVGAAGSVRGIDIAPPMLAIARRRCEPLGNVSFEQADVRMAASMSRWRRRCTSMSNRSMSRWRSWRA